MKEVTVAKTRTPFRFRFPLRKETPSLRPAGTDRLTRREQLIADLYFDALDALPTNSPLALLQGQSNNTLLDQNTTALSSIAPEVATVLWEQISDSGTESGKELAQQLAREYRRIGKAVRPSDLVAQFSFNETAPGTILWSREEAGKLVTNMVEEQQAVVRQVVARGINLGTNRAKQGKELYDILRETRPSTQPAVAYATEFGANVNGLTTRYEQAVFNRMSKRAADLVDRGVTGEKAIKSIRDDANRYADRLRKSRARTIARTEIQRAHNQGRLESYQQMMDQGLVSPQAQKKWVVSPLDVCPICVPLGDEQVDVKASFSNGQPCPPAHPNCRCTTIMVTNPNLYQPPQSLGTGAPDDPFRVRFPGTTPRFDDLAKKPLPGSTGTPEPPAPKRPRRVPQARQAERPSRAQSFGPEESAPSPFRVIDDGKVPAHSVADDGSVVLENAYRDPSGQWFRATRTGDYEPFTPSQNSKAGQIERRIKRDPESYRPRVAPPTPPPTPTPPDVPSPTTSTDVVVIQPTGKVPGHIIGPDGRVTVAGKDEYRDAAGVWYRRRKGATDFETFTPSQNSAAGQIEREIKRNPGRYKVGTPTLTPTPTPTTQAPTPAPAPASNYTKPSGKFWEDAGNKRARDLVQNMGTKDELIVPLSRSGVTRDFLRPLTPKGREVLNAVDETGGRLLSVIEDRAGITAIRQELAKSDEKVKELSSQAREITRRYTAHEKQAAKEWVREVQDELEALASKPGSGSFDAGFILREMKRRDSSYVSVINDLQGLFADGHITKRPAQFVPISEGGFSPYGQLKEELLNARKKIYDERTRLNNARKPLEDQVQSKWDSAVREVMAEIRDDMGTEALKHNASGVSADDISKAMKDMPGRWVQHVNQRYGRLGTGVRVKRGGRAYFASNGQMQLSGKAGSKKALSTVLHEVTHGVEFSNRDLNALQSLHLNDLVQRSGQTEPVSLKKLTGLNYRSDEKAFDLSSLGYTDHYSNKWYGGNGFEIMTRGMEGIFYDATVGMPPDRVRFLLGVLALF